MLTAINSPKSKSISVAFIALKSSIFGLILCYVQQLQADKCTTSLNTISNILKVFYLLGIILDAFSLMYFWCTSQFSRLEYYVFYIFHVILSSISIIVVLSSLNKKSECESGHQFLTGILGVGLVFHLSSIVLMWSTLYFGLKYAHFGSNIVWSMMWFAHNPQCSSRLVDIICFIHLILSFVGMLLFMVMLLMKKTSLTAKLWKYFTFGSLIMMIFCYLMVMLGFLIPSSCESAGLFLDAYERYGLIELISPALILIFLRLEVGDPREKVILRHEQVFNRIKEYAKIENQQCE